MLNPMDYMSTDAPTNYYVGCNNFRDFGVEIEEGDLIWIRDQEHGKPLAIGWAMMSGDDMVAAPSGKAVKSIHHVGDELWELEL